MSSTSSSKTVSAVEISLAKMLEFCGQLAPPLDEHEKRSLVFELPRQSYFTSYCRMFRNHVSFALIRNEVILGVMGAFWDLTILPGPRHFIYTVIDPKVTSSTSLLINKVKKYIAGQGFSLRRVCFSFYPGLHDDRIHDSFRTQGFIPSAKDHRMKLDLPCEFQPRGLHKDYSIEEVTVNTIYELLATWTTIGDSKPFHQAYQQVVSDPSFTTRPYEPSVTLGFLARHGEKPVAGMAINFVGEAACVMNMLVSQNHRRKAIAQNMLNEAVSKASQKGCQIMLVDSADNEAAINLYRKVGFRDMGIHEYLIFREERVKRGQCSIDTSV